MTKHIERRSKLKHIASVEEFERLLNKCVLSEEERSIIIMHYVAKMPLISIGEELGYSESGIKRKHQRIIERLGYFLDK